MDTAGDTADNLADSEVESDLHQGVVCRGGSYSSIREYTTEILSCLHGEYFQREEFELDQEENEAGSEGFNLDTRLLCFHRGDE